MTDKICIIFIALLVISIAPANASITSGSGDKLGDQTNELKEDANDVAQHGYNVKGYWCAILWFIVSIWNCVCFIAGNSWKWWNWGEVWSNICQIGVNVYKINGKIDNTADEGFGALLSTLVLTGTTVISVDTLIHSEEELKEELDSKTNPKTPIVPTTTSLGVNNDFSSSTPIENLETGDVVIYISQGIYLRFLQFITIENQTNTPSLENNPSVLGNNSLGSGNNKPSQNIILKGPYNKIINISYDDFKTGYTGQVIKRDPNNLANSNKLVNSKYKEQKREIEGDQNTLSKNKSKYNIMNTACSVILLLCAITLGFSIIAAAITYYRQSKSAKKAEQFQRDADTHLEKAHAAEDPDFKSMYMKNNRHFTEEAQEFGAKAASFNRPMMTYFIMGVVSFLIGGISLVGVLHSGWALQRVEALDSIYNKNLTDLNSYAITYNLTPPVGVCLNFTTHEGCPVNNTLNGTSIYDSPLGYNITIQPLNGKVSLDPGIPGVFVYSSNPGFIGNDTFSYIVNDLDLGLVSAVANVTVTVNPDKPPVAGNMTVYTAINNSYNGYLDGFDPDNDTLHYSMVTGPLYGVLNLTDDGNFIYTPYDNFTGNDSFTYQTTDNVLNSTIGNVTICVVESKTPIAYNMIFNIAQNSLLNNKFNITGTEGKKYFNILSKPVHGTFNILDESFTYKPFTNYNGQDRVTYNFTDSLGKNSNLATLNIFIRSPPTADNIKISTKINNPIGYNFKIKGYNAISKLLSLPKHGTLKLLGNEKFTYTPYKDYNGTDTFKYQAEDSLGQKSPAAIITISVTKPLKQEIKPTTDKKTNINNQDNNELNNPYKNLLSSQLDLNTINSILDISNLNVMNPADQMKNQIITFIKTIINHIKNITSQIKL